MDETTLDSELQLALEAIRAAGAVVVEHFGHGEVAETNEGAFTAYEAAWRPCPPGSTAYRIVRVADGTGQATLLWCLKYDRDICGAVLIVTETGGTVADARGAPLVVNGRLPTHDGVVACGEEPLDVTARA